MRNRYLGFVICLLICCGSAAAVDAEKEQPQYKARLGIMMKDTPGGIVIGAIENLSAAHTAGLQTGDVLLAVNGMPVTSSQGFLENILPSLAPYTPVTVTYQRNGAHSETTLIPRGRVRMAVREVPPRSLVIPGVPEKNPPGPQNPIEAMDKINVLTQVIIDPRTGGLELVGTYDKRFATGPIPYLDLIKTAVQYPAPGFSLEPTKETLEYRNPRKFESVGQLVSEGLEIALGHPDLEPERQRVIKNYASLYRISPEEYVALYNFSHFDNTDGVVPASIARIEEKVLRNMGYPRIADAYAAVTLLAPGGAEEALRILDTAPGHYPGSLQVQAYFAIQETLANRRAQWTSARRAEVEKGNQAALLVRLHEGILPARDPARKTSVYDEVMTRLVLPDLAMRMLLHSDVTYESELIAVALDPSSQLFRIMYEADYAMKSLSAYPLLFEGIPGAMSQFEYMTKVGTQDRLEKFHNAVRFWFTPHRVDMDVSPERTVVAFRRAEVHMMAEFHDAIKKEDIKFPDDPAPDVTWDKWCAQINNNFDAYAEIIPSFHKLREAAKIIALARWMRDENVTADLSHVRQEIWNGPKTVPRIRHGGFTLQWIDGRGGILRAWSKHGGVNFRPQKKWTSYVPSQQGETKLGSQLALSAGLGKKAVLAAGDGDLEQARHLAELSAQAMSGGITAADLAGQNIQLPEARPVPANPASVQLHKTVLNRTYTHIAALNQGGATGSSAAAELAQLGTLYDQMQNRPAAASDFLTQLQTRKVGTAAGRSDGISPRRAVDPNPAAPQKLRCADLRLNRGDMTAERREYIVRRLEETRNNIKAIDEAMRRIAELNQKDLRQLNELIGEIDSAYRDSIERLAWLAADALLDAKMLQEQEAFKKTTAHYEETREKIDEAIKLARANDEAEALKAAKSLEQAIYEGRRKLYEWGQLGGKGIDYGKSIWSVAEEKDFGEKMQKGFMEAVGIALDHPALEQAWSTLRFFKNARFDVVSSAWNYGQYIVDYTVDLASMRYAWGPLSEQLRGNLDVNRKALLQLREKAALARVEADCLEGLLR